MEQSKGKIGIREYVAIVLLTVGVKLSDDTPAILSEYLSNAYWMAPLIGGALMFIPIYLMVKVVTLYKNKNLHDCILHLFGKYVGKCISIVLLVAFFSAITIDTAIYVDIIGTMYFTQTPTLIIYFVLMLVCGYGAKRGIEHIGSVSWLVLFYVKFSLILALLLSLKEGSLSFLFPFLGPGGWQVVKESSTHVSVFADFFYLGLIAPYLTSAKAFKRGTLIALFIVIIELSITFLFYLFLFDYEPLKSLNYPYHELIRYISVGFLTNIESFFLPIWLIAAFIRFSFYLYLISLFFGGIFNIKNFEYLVPTIATIVVIFGMIPETPTFTIFVLKDSLFRLSSPIFVVLPFIMWMIAKLKGDFKNEKDINHP